MVYPDRKQIFSLFRIRSDEFKYNSIIRHLDEKALIAVSEIVENLPTTDKYSYLKEALINHFTDSEEKRIRQLIAGIELNNKRPSELLREIRQLVSGALSETILHSLWLQRLPYKVQATLAVVENVKIGRARWQNYWTGHRIPSCGGRFMLYLKTVRNR